MRQHPELKNRPFQRALGTSDAKAAWPLAAAALLAYQQNVEQYRAPSPEELRSAWLADLTASRRRELVEAVNAELGGEQRAVFPPGTLFLPEGVEAEGWEDRNDGPSVILPPHPSGNPFLSKQPTEEAVVDTAESAFARALQAVETVSKAIASPVKGQARGRARTWGDNHQPELLRRLAYLVEALQGLGLPREAFPEPLSQVAATLPVHALPKVHQSQKTLRDALVIRTRDLGDDRYRGQIEWALRLFHGIVGEKPLTELRTADLAIFETELRRFPTNTNIRNAILSGKLSVREALDGHTGKAPTLARVTAAKHVSFVRALSRLAFGKGLAGDGINDPFASFQSDRVKKSKVRKHFLSTELDAIAKEIHGRWLPAHPDRIWITLIALFHGARREEICQLLKTDIRQTDKIWCLHITTTIEPGDPEDAAETKRLKTENAERVIPIHQRILDAGFIAFFQKSTGPRLFTSLTQDSDGRWGGNFGKRFGELKTKAGIKGSRTLTFHSFRHTAITAMRAAEWPYSTQLALSGHDPSGSAGDDYGGAAGPTIHKRWIDKIAYSAPELDRLLTMLVNETPVAATASASSGLVRGSPANSVGL